MRVTTIPGLYQCKGFSWEAKGDRAGWAGQRGRGWASSADRLDTVCTSVTQRRGSRAIGPYDYISCGKTSKKVGCSIGSAWVGAEATFDESGHSEVWGGPSGADGHKISFSLGAWFSCDEQKDRQKVFSLIQVNCCREEFSVERRWARS